MCIQETATYTMIQVPRASWECLAGAGSAGGAGGADPSDSKSKVVKRTQSLDRCAAARLVAAAVAARAAGAADRQARQGPVKRGKKKKYIYSIKAGQSYCFYIHTKCEAHM